MFDSWQQTRISVAPDRRADAAETLTPEPDHPRRRAGSPATCARRGALRLSRADQDRRGDRHRRGPTDARMPLRPTWPGTAARGAARHRPAHRAGRDGGAGRRDRRRQVDLVKLLARFYDPETGRGHASTVTTCASSTSRRYRRQLGYVPQEAFLFTGTIRDNIAYGRPEATDAEVEAAARAVGAHDFVAALPGGYHHADRAGPVALGRPAPADRPGPGRAGRPGHPAARRGHLQPRPGDRGPGRGGHAGAR